MAIPPHRPTSRGLPVRSATPERPSTAEAEASGWFPSGLNYTPGQAQNISIVINDAIAAIYGFQISARLESGPSTQQAGVFTAGQNQKVICLNNAVQPPEGCGGTGIQWLEHTEPSLSNTVAVQWMPPTPAPATCTSTFPLMPPTVITRLAMTISTR